MPNLDKIILNRIRLDSCELHEFEVEHLTDFKHFTPAGKITCRKCKGEMSFLDANQYVRGVHACNSILTQIVWFGWCEPHAELTTKCPWCLGKSIQHTPKIKCDFCLSKGHVCTSKARLYFNATEEGFISKENDWFECNWPAQKDED